MFKGGGGAAGFTRFCRFHRKSYSSAEQINSILDIVKLGIFVFRSQLLPHPNHFLSDLTLPGPDQSLPGAQWSATTNSRVEEFDAVILTVPAPQYMGRCGGVGKGR